LTNDSANTPSPPPLPQTESTPAAIAKNDAAAARKSTKRTLPSWLISTIVHAAGLVVIGSLSVPGTNPVKRLFVSMPNLEEIAIEPILPEEFSVSDIPVDETGALSDGSGAFEAASLAPVIAEIPELELPTALETPSINPLETHHAIEIATGTDFSKTFAMKGQAGVSMKGARGAIDRLTHELLVSMEERPTLVAWLFDQSGSLNRQRREVTERFEAIYEQIGDVSASGIFSKFEEEPLLSSIVAFGNTVTLRTPKPTSNPVELRLAVAGIEEDPSGVERTFEAINRVVEEYHGYRSKRNVIIIVFSDEVGDDQHLLDQTVNDCRNYAIPVYVVGVPAPFGQVETMVKWIDPNPQFDQEPQWGRVNQGPESLLPERIQLAFADAREYEPPLDSGFGPYALTRLCYQSGGIYFTVHPNRRTDKLVRARDTSAFAAHFRQFFDEETMRRYRPDYVAAREYQKRVTDSECRQALVRASRESWIEPMDSPRQRFLATSEAEFARNLTDGQKAAAKLEPRLERLFEILERGEQGRAEETEPRWQAGFDLAMGRTMATLVRTRSYNAILANAKRGLQAKQQDTNLWLLRPSDTIEAGSELQRMAEKATTYLRRVITDHPQTPWASLARRELKFPLGWKWSESHFDPPQPRIRRTGDNNMMPADEQRRMLDKPKPRREIPKL
jgi:hypothetical protein